MSKAFRVVLGFFLLGSIVAWSGCCVPTRIVYGVRLTHDRIWVRDLRSLGFYGDEDRPNGSFTVMRQIAFGTDDELVVIGDQDAPPKAPNPVKAFVLSTATGDVVRQVDWISHGAPYVFSTAGGRYVANTLDGIRLYAPGLSEVLATHDGYAKDASPDGRGVSMWGGVPGRAVTSFLEASRHTRSDRCGLH